jgi:Na+/phosphate symporter
LKKEKNNNHNQKDHSRIKSSGAFVSDVFPILWSHPPPLLVLLVLPRVRLSNGLLGGAVLPVTTALRARSTRALPVGDMGMNVDWIMVVSMFILRVSAEKAPGNTAPALAAAAWNPDPNVILMACSAFFNRRLAWIIFRLAAASGKDLSGRPALLRDMWKDHVLKTRTPK